MKKNIKIFSISEVAEQVGLHPNTIRRWFKQGKLPTASFINKDSSKWARRIVFTDTDVKYILNHKKND